MRRQHGIVTAMLIALVLVAGSTGPIAARSKAKVEAVPELCSGLAPADKPVVRVMDFKLKVSVTETVGSGLSTMLQNALVNSGCFTVVEGERLNDVVSEQTLGMSGMVESGSAAAVGKMQGAQFLVMGDVTEFSEAESGAGVAARSFGRLFRRRGRLGAAAGGVEATRAHVGFSIKVVDPTSGVIVTQKSFDKKRTTVGFAAAGWWGFDLLSGMGFKSKAMADAIEEGLIDAVAHITPHRRQMLASARRSGSLREEAPRLASAECRSINVGPPPRVMILIPEEHITGEAGAYAAGPVFDFDQFEGQRRAADGQPAGTAVAATQVTAMVTVMQRIIRPPDPAGETEIMKRLLAFGFRVVDAKQLETLREQEERYRNSNDDPALAAEIGRQYRADIVITGEAFSEFSKNIHGMSTARARVEAKAIDTRTGDIIAADGKHAGGADVSEVIAGKTALRNAGGLVAEAFIPLLCSSSVTGSTIDEAELPPPAPETQVTSLVVEGIDSFGVSSTIRIALSELGSVTDVQREYFEEGAAGYQLHHTGSTDQLADDLIRLASLDLEITGLESGKIVATRKP